MRRFHVPLRYRLVSAVGLSCLLAYCLYRSFQTTSPPIGPPAENDLRTIPVSPLVQLQIADAYIHALAEADKHFLLAATSEGVYSIKTDTATSKLLPFPAQHIKDIYSIIRRDNSFFACRWDKTCFLFDPSSGAIIRRTVLPCRSSVHGAVMTADSKRIVTCTQDVPGLAYLLDPSTLQEVGKIESGDWDISSIAASPRDNTIAIGDRTGTISTYHGIDGRRFASTTIIPDVYVHALSFSPDGATIAAGFSTGDIGLLDQKLTFRQFPIRHDGGIKCVCYSPCGSFLLVGYGYSLQNRQEGNNVIARWNLVDHTLVHIPVPAAGIVRSIIFIENGSRIAVATSAGAVLIYDAHQCLK